MQFEKDCDTFSHCENMQGGGGGTSSLLGATGREAGGCSMSTTEKRISDELLSLCSSNRSLACKTGEYFVGGGKARWHSG